MPICPKCKKRVKKGTANKKKIRGTFIHKECPEERVRRIREEKRLDK